jgi:hypothetical protein
MANFEEERRKHSRFYAHISGIAGAVGLMNFFKDIVTWKGFFAGFIDWWQSYMRPLANFLFGWIPQIWPWPWPEWGYDYIIFSLIFGFGGVRFFQLFMPVQRMDFQDLYVTTDGTPYKVTMKKTTDRESITKLVTAFFVTSLLWPIFIFLLLAFTVLTIINDGFNQRMREALFLAFSPFIYFMIPLILNYAIFFAEFE